MKKAIIEPVKNKPEGVTAEEHKAALKKGEVECNFVTAIEAVRNSRGLYQIKPEKKVEVELRGLKEPEEMTAEELVGEMTMFGKPPRKKMSRAKAMEFVAKLREEAADMISDDDVE